MMKRVHLNLNDRSYDICIGNGILKDLPKSIDRLKIGKDAVIITHPKIARLYGQALSGHLIKQGCSAKILTVPEGESSKSAACAMRLVEQMAAYDVHKKLFIIALGGGVVGDLAGFVAAIYKRGVPYIQCPTTFLAQIDSAIGGKTAIDLRYGKNLVGAIYQPKLVFADTAVLKTLSRRQIQNGLAEAIKYGVIKEPGLFALLEKKYALCLNGDSEVLASVVNRCAAIKARVVEADEKDVKGIRAILNFGHTVGHAIEAASRYGQYQHGEAVALGMRVAAAISVEVTKMPNIQAQRLNDLITAVGLPEKIDHVRLKDVLDLMCHDKKFIGRTNRFILAHTIGQVRLVENVPEAKIIAAIRTVMR